MTTMALIRASRHRHAPVIEPTTYLTCAAILLTMLHFALCGALNLSNDEAYYRLWSLYPSLSYYDHPPMVAWLIAAGRSVAGDSELGVRLLSPLLYLATGAALVRIGVLLYEWKIAILAVTLAMSMPLLNVGAVNMSPDVPSVLFYVLGIWSIAELDGSGDARWWWVIGSIAGLGLLSKYTNLFFGLTVLLWILATPRNRRWLRNWRFWAAGGLAFLISAPVLVWNYEHQWASFAFQFGRVARSSTKPGGHELAMLATLILLAGPIITAMALYGLSVIWRDAIRFRRSRDILLAAAVVPLFIYFFLHALHSQVNGNWLAPVYPLLALCAARGFDAAKFGGASRRVIGAALASAVLITGVIYQHAASPLTGAAADPLEQLRGWQSFADRIDALRKQQGAEWIATSDFGTNAQLAFALHDRARSAQVNERIRYFDGDPITSEMRRSPALLVEINRPGAPGSVADFATVAPVAIIARGTGLNSDTTYKIYRVQGLDAGIN